MIPPKPPVKPKAKAKPAPRSKTDPAVMNQLLSGLTGGTDSSARMKAITQYVQELETLSHLKKLTGPQKDTK